MKIKHGIIVIGASMAGKSTLIETLAKSYNWLSKKILLMHKGYRPV